MLIVYIWTWACRGCMVQCGWATLKRGWLPSPYSSCLYFADFHGPIVEHDLFYPVPHTIQVTVEEARGATDLAPQTETVSCQIWRSQDQRGERLKLWFHINMSDRSGHVKDIQRRSVYFWCISCQWEHLLAMQSTQRMYERMHNMDYIIWMQKNKTKKTNIPNVDGYIN